jgi:hypothetical protein
VVSSVFCAKIIKYRSIFRNYYIYFGIGSGKIIIREEEGRGGGYVIREPDGGF